MNEQFDISVVISTYNRCDMLPEALESVAAQETAAGVRYEVVVVDNNSTDKTQHVVESFIRRGHDNVRYVFEGKQGLSHARNAGIDCTKSPVISFTDDDVRVAPDWIASIKRAFDEHPEADFVGGKVLPKWPHEPPAWLDMNHWIPLALLDYGDAPFPVSAEKPVCFVGANISFRREAFARVGLFTPDLQRVKDGIGSSEDHDMQLRLWRAGRLGWYAPEASITAEVQLDRMAKAYHRKWFAGHGRFASMMRKEEIFAPGGELFDGAANAATLFGTPGFIYRDLAKATAHWLGATARRQESSALAHENRIRYLANYVRKRREQTAHERTHSALSEIGSFIKTLLLKKNNMAANKHAADKRIEKHIDKHVRHQE